MPVDMSEIEALIAIRVGEPFDAELVRRTLRNLRLSGRASEVEALREDLPDGVEIDLVLRPDIGVDSVKIEGDSGLPAAELLATVPQKAGQPLREDRVVRGVYRIEERLAAAGWLSAVAHVEVSEANPARQVEVRYRITSGPRTAIGQVSFVGLGPVSAKAALVALRSKPGGPYRSAMVREDADRLTRFLVSNEYRLCEVSEARVTSHGTEHSVDLEWKVSLGPRFEFELVGADRKSFEKHDLLPFLGDSGFDEALLQQSMAQIRRYYQERGHYRVEVREQRSEDEGVLHLRLDVVPGPRFVLDEVKFEGNQTFTDDRLQRLLSTAPRRMLQLERGRLVDEELNEDLSNLRSFYALQGFDRARIGPPRIEDKRGNRLRLVIPIEEGPRRLVGSVEIAGLHALDPAKVAQSLLLKPGGPYHRLLVESGVDEIRRRLERLGYRTPLVEPETTWDDSQRLAAVRFQVLEGERSSIEAVIVRGNTRTRTSVIRHFVGLRPGDPISTERLLTAQQALYRLGIFSRVQISVPTTDAEFAAHEVLVEVEEGKARSVAYGAGYDSESGARGLLRFSNSDLWGRADTVQLDAIVGQRNQLYRALISQPYIGDWPAQIKGTIYRQIENRPTFDVRRKGLQVGVERTFGKLRLGLYYDYRIVDLETSEPTMVIPRESRNARVASVTPTLLWDHRNDPVDPSRGWSGLFQVERAFPVLAADSAFAKLFSQWTGYLPLGRAGVVASSLRGGWIRPIAEPVDPTLSKIDAVPAAELFYAGGRTTHRAFARDELGIPGQTLFVEPGKNPVPLGGGVLALLNLEWRFPVAGALGGDLFVDGGNVWREVSDFRASEARWGAGLGIRYASPIGPLRVEIGWKIHRKPYEDGYVAFISLGNAF